MTSTDRAFIAALQQSSAVVGAAAPTGQSTPHFAAPPAPGVARPAGDAAPQTAERPTRAPLSAHLASRRAAAAPARETARPEALRKPATPRPGVEVDHFRWPRVAESLAQLGRAELLAVLDATTRSQPGTTPAVAMIAAVPGVGATTTLLATAALVAGVGGKVALLDVGPAGGAATALGVRRPARESHAATSDAIDDATVATRDGGVSVVALARDASPRFAAEAFAHLAAAHDLVLIDAGDAASAPDWLAEVPAYVALVDASDAPPTRRAAAVANLATRGVAVRGVVESPAAMG